MNTFHLHTHTQWVSRPICSGSLFVSIYNMLYCYSFFVRSLELRSFILCHRLCVVFSSLLLLLLFVFCSHRCRSRRSCFHVCLFLARLCVLMHTKFTQFEVFIESIMWYFLPLKTLFNGVYGRNKVSCMMCLLEKCENRDKLETAYIEMEWIRIYSRLYVREKWFIFKIEWYEPITMSVSDNLATMMEKHIFCWDCLLRLKSNILIKNKLRINRKMLLFMKI